MLHGGETHILFLLCPQYLGHASHMAIIQQMVVEIYLDKYLTG